MGASPRYAAACRASLFHLSISLVVATIAAALVFGLWFPYPYRELAGGRELFWIVMGVDVVCGPLLTLVLFNPLKSRRELFLDLGLVALVQIGALVYGLHTVAMARPIYLVWEVDRFKVISTADVVSTELKPELKGFHELPWSGPKIIGLRSPKDASEKLESLELSLNGVEPTFRPDWWQAYDQSTAQVLARAKPISQLRLKRPEAGDLIDQKVAETRLAEENLVWVPVTSFKTAEWVAFLSKQSAEVKVFAPIDGF